MDTEKAKIIYALFDSLIIERRHLDILHATVEEFTRMKPGRPAVVKSLQEWEKHEEIETDYTARLDFARQAVTNQQQVVDGIERGIKNVLPAGVWFEYGDHAIGVSFDNTWMNKQTVEVQPIQADSQYPGLDYTGW